MAEMTFTPDRIASSSQESLPPALLVESAWEVCNQVGGIYTVIRSKVPSMIDAWDERYCLVGPYFKETAEAEFEPTGITDDPFGRTVQRLRNMGMEVHYGRWLVPGRPRVVLFNPYNVYNQLGFIKAQLYEHHQIETPSQDQLIDQVVAFGYQSRQFYAELSRHQAMRKYRLLIHIHEWMAGTPIPSMRRDNLNLRIIFTTHATSPGRFLAMNDPQFYDHLPFLDWHKESAKFNILPQVQMERAAAHGAHVFTTVSDVTARECEHLLGRKPDVILPNGLNIERFTALHEFQNLHQQYKQKIHRFVMGHFFPSYKFDLDNTLYFFTSGRYEYRNKGFDLTLEALARLNYRMKQAGTETTIVMFFITRRPFSSINPNVLQSRALMEELRQTCSAIEREIGEKLFYEVAAGQRTKLPSLNDFIDDYWKLRLRKTLYSWRSSSLPPVVTHNLVEAGKDEILNFVRAAQLVNKAEDRVKIVYHPDFVSPTSPLFGMDYSEFVRGCHMGVFPSYYEPWGYTPLECVASGVPTVTSDLAGFGDYVRRTLPDHDERGIYVVRRSDRSFDEAANQLASDLMSFASQTRRDRIAQRNRVERSSEMFDWQNLRRHYDEAYERSLVE